MRRAAYLPLGSALESYNPLVALNALGDEEKKTIVVYVAETLRVGKAGGEWDR